MFQLTDGDRGDYLNRLLDLTKQCRDTCQRNRWKVSFRGQEIIVRDIADKLVAWVDKFKTIGDIVIQYDPVHAALPWAGVRFILQIVVADEENMGAVLIGIETVTKLLVRCTVYEELYLKPDPKLSNHSNLEETLLGLYAAVLECLAEAKRYLQKSSASKY
jgi:hypothetical protein